MNRLFTKDATGVAPNGRLYPGDINALEDAVAAITDLAQALSVGSLAIGESGLQLLRYGTLEARLTGALRIDGILRGLGGICAGTFSTAARDAIPLGSRPYGLVILNTNTNRYEWNAGTDAAPNWLPVGPTGPWNTADIVDAAITSAKIADGTIATVDLADSSVTSAKIVDGTIAVGDIAASVWSTVMAYGVLSARPTASGANLNYYYYATDSKILYQNVASAWVVLTATALYTTSVGNGASTSITVNHNLGSQNVIVQVRQNASPFAIVEPEVQVTDANNVTLIFDVAPTSGQYVCIVVGGATGAPSSPSAHASSHAAGGSDALAWGTIHGRGTLALRAAAAAGNSGYRYVATDVQGGTEYQSDGSAWNQVARSLTDQLAYVEFTSDKAATTAVEATAQTVVSAGAVAFDGATKIRIEFFVPSYSMSDNSNGIILTLFDGSTATPLGQLFKQAGSYGNTAGEGAIHVVRELTPSNASHTYFVGINDSGAAAAHATVHAGVGGAGALMPGFIKLSKV